MSEAEKIEKAMNVLNNYDYKSDKSVQAALNLIHDIREIFKTETANK